MTVRVAFDVAGLPIVKGRPARPKGHTGKRGLLPSAPAYPATRPDLDKLARAALDALTAVAFADDAQVVRLVAEKAYGHPGASIEVAERLP